MSTAQWLGLLTGIAFGFLLQKGRVLRFDKQLGAMLLKDMTIIKFILSAILVGMVGIIALSSAGIITLSHKPMNLGAILLGGTLFGGGWAIMGFCPGTSVGALGEGRWDSAWGIVGMLCGAALYAEAFPTMKATVLTWGDFGKITLPQILGVSHWFIIPLFIIGGLLLFRWFEKKGL